MKYIPNSYTYSIFLKSFYKVTQNLFGGGYIGGAAHFYERIGLFGWEVAFVFVEVDAGFETFGVGLRVELGGIDVLLVADHLEWASWGSDEMGAAFGQGLHGFFVADEGVEIVGKVAGERVLLTRGGKLAGGGADGLAVVFFGNGAAEMVAEDSDTVAAAQEWQIVFDDLGHEGEHGGFDSGLDGGFVLWRIRHAAGATADDDSGIVLQIEACGQRLRIQPDAVGLGGLEARLLQDGGVFAIGRFGFGAELEDEEGHAGFQLVG